jgi:curved DNA-binding protein CbpA
MQDLYSVLGVSSQANSTQIKAAYRLKAKLSHPDLHGSDKEAEKRFQKINYAYRILSEPEARAVYNHKLSILRKRVRRRWGAAATAALASFAIMITTISLIWRSEVGTPPLANYQVNLKPNSVGDRSLIAETPEGHTNNALEAVRRNELAPSGEIRSTPADPRPGKIEIAAIPPPNHRTELAAVRPAAPVQEAAPQTNSTGTEMLDQNSAHSVKVLSSSGESDNVGKSSPSDFAMSRDKNDMRRRDTGKINTGDVKISDLKVPESKMLGIAPVAAKLLATSRTNFEQTSLENRNTCSESQICSRKEPPLFGVGF